MHFSLDQWIGISGTSIGIIGVCLAIFYGRRSEKRRLPTFVVQPGRDLICKKILTAFTDFTLTWKNENLAGSDIVGLRVQFWNSGNLPILEGEILKPFAFSLPDGCKLLDIRLIKQSRDEVKTEVKVSQRTITISFAIMEPNDGVNIQVIYSGSIDAALDFEGACLGAAQPKVLSSGDANYKSFRENFPGFLKGLGMLISFVAFIYVASKISIHFPRFSNIAGQAIGWLFGLLAAFAIFSLLWSLTRSKSVPKAITKITK